MQATADAFTQAPSGCPGDSPRKLPAKASVDAALMTQILLAMFRPGREKLKSAITSYFAPEATFRGPLIEVAGRDNVFWFLRFWMIAFNDLVQIKEIMVEGDTALMQTVHHLRPRLLPFITIKIGVDATAKFDAAAERRISMFDGRINIYSLLDNIPLFTWAWERTGKVAGGWVLTMLGQGLDWAMENARHAVDWKPLQEI